jgi:mannose-1-phosphate guanylyltransferase/mannose-6-phosphate isomerase
MSEIRPWGEFHTIHSNKNSVSANETFQVKRIIVKPHQKLSLQYHNRRSEHWVVVKGSIIAQVGDDFHTINRNSSIYIPKGTKHRIVNTTDEEAELIEVQIGEYVGEDDIVRLEDMYGRNNITNLN